MSPEVASDELQARIGQLWIYPVKSCAGVALDSAVLTLAGLDLDRAWMVVDENREFVSQRELPRMALIRPQLRSLDLVLRAPGMLALHLQIGAAEAPLRVRVWDDVVPAFDMGEVAAQWFSDFLGRKLRLVRFDPDHRRLSDMRWTAGHAAPTLFSDGFALLVASEAALEEFNQQLAARGHGAVGIERFRPNLVLSDVPAHAEDHLDELRIAGAQGQARLRLVKPCARCGIPDIDPATAESGRAVGELLLHHRRDARLQGALTWGMNAIVLEGDGLLLSRNDTVSARYAFT